VITQTQRSIEQYQHNPYLSARQKASIIDSLQASVKQQQDQLAKTKNTLLPIIEGYAVAIVPLVFLTRPSVKTVFS
jgi:polyphosphate kinase 2 (PPK2 family)